MTRPSSNTSPNTGLTLLFYTHRAGSEAGHIEWGGAGPHDAGGYNNLPHETGFFTAHEGSWDSEYGQFFLSWYAGELVEHGDRMLRCARNVFERDDDATGLNISEGIGEGISEGNSSTGTFSKKGKNFYTHCEGVARGVATGKTSPVPPCFMDMTVRSPHSVPTLRTIRPLID